MSARIRRAVVPIALVLGLAVVPPQTTAQADPAKPNPPVWTSARPTQTVTFYVSLRRPEDRARRQLRAASDPSSAQYRRFLPRGHIRKSLGAFAASRRRVADSATNAGLSAKLDPTGVFMRLTGSVADMERWLGAPIRMHRQRDRFGGREVTTTIYEAPEARLPASLAHRTRGLLPVYMTTHTRPSTGVAAQAAPKSLEPNLGTWIGGCSAARNAEPPSYSFAQLSHAYGVDQLPATAAAGRQSRMAILALGNGFSTVAARRSAQCFNLPGRSFTRVSSDGVVGKLSEGIEGNLDTQLAQAVLPQDSTITVVEGNGYFQAQQPEALSVLQWFTSFATAWDLPKLPDAVSVSYGVCEADVPRRYAQVERDLMNSVLVRLGLAGTTVTIATGDTGSSSCSADIKNGKRLSVSWPASSPFVTAIGGSRIIMTAQNDRSNEVVWREKHREYLDTLMPKGAGGGGRSQWFSAPWWQRGGPAGSRGLPDIAMHAAQGPSWPVAITNQTKGTSAKGHFVGIAGTSAASPYFASTVALLAADERLAGRNAFGHMTPALYGLGWQRGGLFDIVEGNNDLYDLGCCSAQPGYDLASGLGSPNFATWPGLLPGPGSERG